ncbi:MAG: 16S rRNA (cytosine(1402)-N(4))-methyltransferase RsmH [Cyanobacteria bacterium SIG30]|nr:16S rRNA (cytosine(1402)-N(4))-methyltransferase RsmH [Cyanobacteria bacterium SIG30]
MDFKHYTVMLNEAALALKPENSNKIFIDATLGGGGHSKLIAQNLSKDGLLISFDVDKDAINKASEVLKEYKNVTIIQDSYTTIPEHLEKLGIKKITGGIIFDLGASYHQLTKGERGFSFMKDAPLDMRFNQEQEKSAFDVVNTYKEGDLARIFTEYGEERFSKRIARAIVENRPIYTTLQLADLIKKVTPKTNSKIHCATRVFQAIRIEVNNELLNFENTLKRVVKLLDSDAIISIITFHSLEDRIAKNVLRDFAKTCRCKKSEPVCKCEGKLLNLINKKPICASDEEIRKNPPSRSAKLRLAQRV